ncbi:MAG: DUF4038 domain-containing protein [Anaerolineae bacterium]|nr:glycoside hydrolase family 140 protein [Thermoflexales bacterium]MDW8408059.1 DUF4038 domain-containing protein [Anaerolineae bacterium]
MHLPRIQVSANRRFLVTEAGEPFFWLGDTAWELFHRLTLAEAEHYLEVRRQQGFNIIQAVALAELDGLHTPNANGHVPLCGDDPTRPNEFYFRHVDAVIRLAAQKGIYIGLLPTWGDKVHSGLWGTGPVIFTAENARVYGRFLGQRYRNDSNIVWILGGDRPAEGYEEVWGALAEGIAEGLGFKPFCTYHPRGGSSSSAWLHEADWLDMNMMQSGHCLVDAPNWEMIRADYERTPVKPVLDGEPNYEHHPIDPYLRPWKPEYGRFTDYDVRKQAYRAVFAGACGHTYGSHSIWQMYARNREPVTFASPTWEEAVYGPGAQQMIHLKRLMLSRPYLSRIPAQDMLPDLPRLPLEVDVEDRVNPVRAAHAVATRDSAGRYAFVYFPLPNQTLRVDLSALNGAAHAAWYDPRTGHAYPIGDSFSGLATFTSPLGGPDWVLTLDTGQ